MASLYQIRQTAAEILAAAFINLFPGATLLKGAATEFGFYYDFLAEQPVDESFLPLLEEGMRGLLKNEEPVRSLEMMRENARNFFEHLKQPHIAEHVSASASNIVSIFQLGGFYDYLPSFCFSSKDELGAFKLLSIECLPGKQKIKNSPPVRRIHGIAAQESGEVKQQLKALKRGWKQDHRTLGREMDLFESHPEASACEWFWRPNGSQLLHLLLDFLQKSQYQQGFLPLFTPSFLNEPFIRKIERNQEAQDQIEASIDQEVCVFPSTLAYSHALMYQSHALACCALPVRYAECARIARKKTEGELWGVLNSRIVSADYAHIFCTTAQLKNEIISSLQFILKIIKMFSFEHRWIIKGFSHADEKLSSRRSRAQECLVEALEQCHQRWQPDGYEQVNEQKFSIDLALQMIIGDSCGREWAGPSIEVNLNLPERLKLSCGEENGQKEVPYMLCLSTYGSLERFAALLIEHYAGCFPFWLVPEQGRIIPLHQEQMEYAEQIASELRACGFRFGVERKPGALKSRIQEAARAKVPYLIFVGQEEEKEKLLTVRIQEEVQKQVILKDFLKQLQEQDLTSKLSP